MASQGIYTLANDIVYDQLVALLNSIEVNVGKNFPVCIIPYDDRLEKVKLEVKDRPNVSLFDKTDSIQLWENFARDVWLAHPQANRKTTAHIKSRIPLQRRYAAFDGEFEKFVFYDADCLAMKPLDKVFDRLDAYDFVFDDWEHRKSDADAALNLEVIAHSGHFSLEEVRSHLHCSSFFGGKKGCFPPSQLGQLKQKLIQDEEVKWIKRIMEAFLFNYLTLRGQYRVYNFTQSSEAIDRTGNCADADPFINIDNVLYNEQGLKPIHRIHYMNYSSADFARLCQGEDTNICYQDVFLHYRFLKNPDQKPAQLSSPSSLTKATRKLQGIVSKIKRTIP